MTSTKVVVLVRRCTWCEHSSRSTAGWLCQGIRGQLQLNVRHINGMPSCIRHRGSPQVSPSKLVTCCTKISTHDNWCVQNLYKLQYIFNIVVVSQM